MFEKIPAPVKGQPARASWGAALTSRVNELCAMAPARGLARDGLTGTGFAALPSNRRERPVVKIPGCFEYAGTVDESGNKFYGRPYFTIGSRLYRAKDEDVACGASEGIDYLDVTLDKGQIKAGQIKAEVGHANDYAELQVKADDKNHAIIPLYEFGTNGKPVADLRNIPTLSAWEFST